MPAPWKGGLDLRLIIVMPKMTLPMRYIISKMQSGKYVLCNVWCPRRPEDIYSHDVPPSFALFPTEDGQCAIRVPQNTASTLIVRGFLVTIGAVDRRADDYKSIKETKLIASFRLYGGTPDVGDVEKFNGRYVVEREPAKIPRY